MNDVQLVATSAFGLESIVANELKNLGYEDLQLENGRVSFTADQQAIARCNLWLRSADRLLIKVGEFPAQTFDELFEQTRALPWNSWLPENANFPVQGKSIKSRLFSVSDCQAIVKKAVVESLKARHHRTWFTEDGPRYKIEVSLLNDIATLTLDTSGSGLHKRGYRQLTHAAPLKETLAAAMVQISRWKPDRAFIDPLCGSGTIALEAALIGRNMAPGLLRKFDAEEWTVIPLNLWHKARQEARDLARPEQPLGILGFDRDSEAVSMARYHARQAGIGSGISFQRQEINALQSRYQYGYLITNPPYGERLLTREELRFLYQDITRTFTRLDTWSFYVLSADMDLEKWLKRKADKRRKLYNGRILCNFYQFYGPRPLDLAGPFAAR
ncbi:MAG TPA: class I SAM-dependent RNA methyltransferase [Syntrophomonadaceae bacterium]|nr:class I SAM-dependent RNA methyltransferase [Syntrophomonadaceae bacterium]